MTRSHSTVGILLLVCPIIVVYLAKPPCRRTILDIPKARETGDSRAKLVIVEYADFQCPVCALVDPSVRKLLKIYDGQIRLVYKYYPLAQMHQNAIPAARAAECAANQNQFWRYHDLLFETQRTWATLQDPTTSFIAIARGINLNLPGFQACYVNPATLVPIEHDIDDARTHQVLATPTFLVNDERLVGRAIETDGARTIESELRTMSASHHKGP